MTVFILTIVDLEHYGFNPKDVQLCRDKSEAIEIMRKQYLEACKEWKIENPFDQDNGNYQFTDDYAYIFGEYYWDIFPRTI